VADHTEFTLMAEEMIAEDGREVTLKTHPEADPSKPWRVGSEPQTEYTAMAVMLELTEQDLTLTDVQVGDKKFLLQKPAGITSIRDVSSLEDPLTGYTFRIVRIDTIAPGDQVVCHFIYVRQ
jgi:hypothetical protein